MWCRSRENVFPAMSTRHNFSPQKKHNTRGGSEHVDVNPIKTTFKWFWMRFPTHVRFHSMSSIFSPHLYISRFDREGHQHLMSDMRTSICLQLMLQSFIDRWGCCECNRIYDASLQQPLTWVLPVLPLCCLWSSQNKQEWQRLSRLLHTSTLHHMTLTVEPPGIQKRLWKRTVKKTVKLSIGTCVCVKTSNI